MRKINISIKNILALVFFLRKIKFEEEIKFIKKKML